MPTVFSPVHAVFRISKRAFDVGRGLLSRTNGFRATRRALRAVFACTCGDACSNRRRRPIVGELVCVPIMPPIMPRRELAAYLGVQECTARSWEAGGTIMMQAHRAAVAVFIGLPEDDLMRDMGNRLYARHGSGR